MYYQRVGGGSLLLLGSISYRKISLSAFPQVDMYVTMIIMWPYYACTENLCFHFKYLLTMEKFSAKNLFSCLIYKSFSIVSKNYVHACDGLQYAAKH